MGNFVLKRVESVKIGAYGAAEGACTDLGSVREIGITIAQETLEATASKYNDAVVDVALGAAKGEAMIVAEEITQDNLVFALGATEDGTSIEFSGTTATPTFLTMYVRGYYVDGSPYLFHMVKGYIKPNTELKLGKEQMLLNIPMVIMVDPDASDYKMYSLKTASADTTAPTISSVNPPDAQTGVSRTSTVVWTFSEAIRTECMNANNFFVHTDAGAIQAGTLQIGTNNTVVTFTPTGSMAGTTKHHAVVVGGAPHGVRDVAGNFLAAISSTEFTTVA